MTFDTYTEVTYEKNNILEHVVETIAEFPTRELVISGDGKIRLTYADVNKRANQLVGVLKNAGVQKGTVWRFLKITGGNTLSSIWPF